jgi:hypothetical protein
MRPPELHTEIAALSLEQNMYAGSMRFDMVSEGMERKKSDRVFEGRGRTPDPWPETINVTVPGQDGPDFAKFFTLDGMFECGLIARHP